MARRAQAPVPRKKAEFAPRPACPRRIKVNQMIQKAARLRVGASKARVVAASRAAIKSNNMNALFKVLSTGA